MPELEAAYVLNKSFLLLNVLSFTTVLYIFITQSEQSRSDCIHKIMFFLSQHYFTHNYCGSRLHPSPQKKNVLHYVNQTVTCMCVHRGFIRRQMKRHAKCNYTRCAWHLTTLYKWSLQLELMKEAICKTIQVQMMVNL